jgi:hypothetical protein
MSKDSPFLTMGWSSTMKMRFIVSDETFFLVFADMLYPHHSRHFIVSGPDTPYPLIDPK